MEWDKLLCTERQQKKWNEEGVNSRMEQWERDYERGSWVTSFTLNEFDEDYLSIISSQAFRRLQDKTQVFPLDKSDFVRTRLTHSMEVAAIAADLASLADTLSFFGDSGVSFGGMLDGPKIKTIVSCAGLLHDTGNPPFGHYGEEVIRDWFRRKFEDERFTFRGKQIGSMLKSADPRMTADFENFEGNAQGLRILSKAGLHEGGHDVNLTYAVMNTLIKYPNPSTDFDKHSPDVKRHKMGYYYAEREIMDKICTATGTKIQGEYVRHPLVYIMEAADDIAYATADLADSMKKGRFTVTEFIRYYEEEANAVVDLRMREYIEMYTDDQPLYEKLRRYYDVHRLMRAKASVDWEHRDHTELKRLDDERHALFQTEEEQAALTMLEQVKDRAKNARNRLNSLRKHIAQARKTAAEEKAGNDSVLRRALYHSDTPETEFAIFENWLEEMRIWLMESAIKNFLEHYDEIMAGEFMGELCEGNESSDAMHIMKKAMATFVYDSHEIVSLELSAKWILESLLEDFTRAVLYADEPDEAKHMSTIDDRFVHMIPDNFKLDYLGAKKKVEERVAAGKQTRENADAEELYLRFLMVTDFVSGMTDSYARNLYRITNGVE